MLTVVSDTGPLNYLTLIGQTKILPALFGAVSVPQSVLRELVHPEAPSVVRQWVATSPAWLDVRPDVPGLEADLDTLDDGERATIRLARSIGAGLILMDDRVAVATARRMEFAVAGTIALLDRAARLGLLDLTDAFRALQATSFRCRPALLDALLARRRLGGRD